MNTLRNKDESIHRIRRITGNAYKGVHSENTPLDKYSTQQVAGIKENSNDLDS